MHTAANQPSETTTFNPQTAEEALAHIKAIYRIKRLKSEVTMVAAQTTALEALAYCMKPVQTTGDPKLDAFYARERNRQRLAAIQTLLHIRTVQREKRLRQTTRAKQKANAKSTKGTTKGAMVGAEGEGHADSSSTVPSPLAGEGGRASGRMRGRSETSDHSKCSEHARTSLSMPPKPFPTPSRSAPAARIIADAGSPNGLANPG